MADVGLEVLKQAINRVAELACRDGNTAEVDEVTRLAADLTLALDELEQLREKDREQQLQLRALEALIVQRDELEQQKIAIVRDWLKKCSDAFVKTADKLGET